MLQNVGSLNLNLDSGETVLTSTQGIIKDKIILFILTSQSKLVEVEMNKMSVIEKSDIRRDITAIKYFDEIPMMLFASTYD